MTERADTDWDLVEDLVFQCLELRSDGGDAAVAELLARQPEPVAQAVRCVLADVSHRDTPVAAALALPELRIPDRLGTYELGRRLGQGGMGAVYAATDTALGREVAIKVVRPDLLALGQARERFRREVEAVARLSHPGIVQVYQVGEDSGVPWFAMELVRGVSLADVITALRGRDPATLSGEDLRVAARADETSSGASTFAGTWERACVRLARELADALTHAHGRSVLHRDVKPSNVLVDTAGHARLCDFGLAHADDGVELTKSGTLLGSLPYAPPEQVRGDKAESDARADVYSLGVTLYELLSLRSPFLAEREAETRRNVEQGNAPPLARLCRTVSWEVAAVVSVAMDKDPERRYRSMAEFAADLQRVLDRRPIVARPPGSWLRMKRAAERHPVAATGVVASVVALVGLVLVYTLGLQEQRDEALAARAEAERLRDVDRQRGYRAGVQAAQLALRLGQADVARDLLDGCPEEARSFEWFHLHAQLDESVVTRKVSERFLRRVVATDAGTFAAGLDGAVHVLDPGDGEERQVLRTDPPSPVLGLAASADGRELVSGHADHSARVWDLATASLRGAVELADLYGERQLPAHQRACYGVAFTADGGTAYVTGGGGAVAAIDVRSARRKHGFVVPVTRGLFAVAVAPAGDLLALGCDQDVLLVRSDGEQVARLSGHRGFVFSLQFSADGATLLSGSQDRTARTWSVADARAGLVLFGHEGEVHQATFAPDGSIWTASNDGTLRQWDTATGRERQRRLGHATAVYSVAARASSTATMLMSAGWDGTVRWWNGDASQAKRRIGGAGRTGRQLLVHGGGTRCTVLDDGHGVRTFALPSGELLDPVLPGKVDAIAIQGHRIAFVRDREVRLTSSSGAPTDGALLEGAEGEVMRLAFRRDFALVAAEHSGHVICWPATGGAAARRAGHDGEVLVLQPVGDGVLSAGMDGRVLLWRGDEAPRELLRRDSWDGAATAPDERRVYLCGLGRIVALDAGDWRVLWERELPVHMRDLAVTAGGRRLLVAGTDRVLHVLDATDGETVLGLPGDNLFQFVDVADGLAVTSTVYSEVDVWYAR